MASDPGYAEARFSLANALRRIGRVQESLSHYAEVLRIRSSSLSGQLRVCDGAGAARALSGGTRHGSKSATKAFPDQPGFAHALARLLAAAPDDRVRDGARALSIMSELMKAQQTLAMAETMAMALAELHRFDEAVKWQQEAIAGATEGEAQRLLTRSFPRICGCIRDGQPCRTPWADDDPVHHPVSEHVGSSSSYSFTSNGVAGSDACKICLVATLRTLCLTCMFAIGVYGAWPGAPIRANPPTPFVDVTTRSLASTSFTSMEPLASCSFLRSSAPAGHSSTSTTTATSTCSRCKAQGSRLGSRTRESGTDRDWHPGLGDPGSRSLEVGCFATTRQQ